MIVDLIIPMLNERPNVQPLFEALPAKCLRHVIVADNGSTDGTTELARQGAANLDVVVVCEPRRGYGAACLAGLAWISEHAQTPPDAVAFLDADLSDDPACLAELIKPIADGEADMVIGCRHKLAQPGALDPHQRFGNWLACWLIGLATGRRYRDLGPMRAVRWSSLEKLQMADMTWGWTVEMQFKAAVKGLRTVEVDVPYRGRQHGKSKISGSIVGSFRAGTKIITTIAALTRDHRRRKK